MATKSRRRVKQTRTFSSEPLEAPLEKRVTFEEDKAIHTDRLTVVSYVKCTQIHTPSRARGHAY